MKVLVIPDVHLKTKIFDNAEKLLKAQHVDKTVFLGDFVDDWGQENNIGLYNKTFDRLLRYCGEHDSLICWGNHDMSYVWGKLESGYSYMARQTVQERIREVEKELNGNYYSPDYIQRTAYIHRIDRIVFCHGGLTGGFVADHLQGITETCNKKVNDIDIDDVITVINSMGPISLWENNSPLWARPNWAYNDEVYKGKINGQPIFQVVGHTPIAAPIKYDTDGFGYVVCDTFSTDHKGKPIGSQEYIIIDTETADYKAIKP